MNAYGYDYQEANVATKSIPDLLDGEPITYDYVIKVVNNKDEFAEKVSDNHVATIVRIHTTLDELFKKYPEVYDAVTRTSGCVVNTGQM